MSHSTSKKWAAEFVGTFWLTFAGCGSAVVAAGYPGLGIGFAGVALAFGLSVLTASYALGGVSGGHFNPAVSIGLMVGGRLSWVEALGYIVFQVAGAVVGAALLFVIANGKAIPELGAFATNGYGASSPGGYGLLAAFLTEFVLTAIFLIVVLGATSKRNPAGFAGLAIGMCLTLIHLISIPITNTSVNPARSTGPALFGPPAALLQLWMFWLAPCLGAVAGALIYKFLLTSPEDEPLPTLAHAKTVMVM
ncbi:MAG: aquaporin Z [Pseudomonas sp.]|nr:MAG: aquaporin Z [Pseudomonas sp.]